MKTLIHIIIILSLFQCSLKVQAQCTIIASNNDSISCGNSVKLSAISPWQQKVTGNTSFLNSIYFINSNLGFAVGENGKIIKTINGGNTWNAVNSSTTASLNSVVFINDTIGFSHQHAVRRLPNGNITLFDNGNLHWDKICSRGLEYKLDETNKTAELVWSFVNDTAIYSKIMGYVQRLPNGNTIMGWGSGTPSVIEVDSLNNKKFQLSLPNSEWSYRALKFDLNKSYFSSFMPEPNFPKNDIELETNSINFSWTKNLLSQSFHLQISTDSTFNFLLYDSLNIIDTVVAVNSLEFNKTYFWRVLSNNNTNTIGGYSNWGDVIKFKNISINSEINSSNTDDLYLSQNEPNPFSSNTEINYYISNPSFVHLIIYNSLGLPISNLVNNYQGIGKYNVKFDLSNFSSGIYYYKLQTGGKEIVKVMNYIK